MDYDELKKLSYEDRSSYLDDLEEDELEELLDALLEELSDDDEVSSNIYETDCVYYIISDGEILEISNDAGDSPGGGWFPPIEKGLPKEMRDAISNIADSLERYGELEDIFIVIEDNFDEEFDDDDVLEMFEDVEDEGDKKLYKGLIRAVKKSDGMFTSVADFYAKWRRFELEADRLYYYWEGEYIDFYENIEEFGEARGEIDGMDTREWIEELCSLESSIVSADEE